jgi:bile acid:Na+ symporter, BASS family
MEESLFVDLVLPLSLVVIMAGLGMSLSFRDFRRVLLEPRAALVGLGNQIVLLPLVAFGLATFFGLSPAFAVGLMLIAACPGGPTSNLITFVSRGDTALSISLTALSSVVTVATIPLILAFSIGHFGVEADAIRAPVGEIALQVVAITGVPVTAGLLVRRFRPGFADRMERPVRIASALIFVMVLAAIVVDQRRAIVENFAALGAVTASLNVATMVLGFAIARAAALELRQSVTISIESGIQNGTLAIVIAMSILGAADIALAPGFYSLVMFVSGGALMGYFGTVAAALGPRGESAGRESAGRESANAREGPPAAGGS